MRKRALVLTGGGDCPGLNAVIRGIVKRSSRERDWEIIGSYEAFNGILREPMDQFHGFAQNAVKGFITADNFPIAFA